MEANKAFQSANWKLLPPKKRENRQRPPPKVEEIKTELVDEEEVYTPQEEPEEISPAEAPVIEVSKS